MLFIPRIVFGLDPDASFAELRALFTNDEGAAVPETVFNALRQRPERVPIAMPVSASRGAAPQNISLAAIWTCRDEPESPVA